MRTNHDPYLFHRYHGHSVCRSTYRNLLDRMDGLEEDEEMSYAENTSVPIYNSVGEIHKCIMKYGGDSFMQGQDGNLAGVQFAARGKMVRMMFHLPDPDDKRFTKTPTGRTRKPATKNSTYDQEIRRRWRALALVIKARFEAIESEIETFEQAFLPHIVTNDGRTIGEVVIPQIEESQMPNALPFLS